MFSFIANIAMPPDSVEGPLTALMVNPAVSSSMFVPNTSGGLSASYIVSDEVELSTLKSMLKAWLPSVRLSSTPVTVNCFSPLQLVVVNCQDEGDTEASVVLSLTAATVTVVFGSLVSLTEKTALVPVSETVPLRSLTTNPAVSSSTLVNSTV